MADPRTPAVRLAVLGSPIAHSLSPRLHAAAYGVLGLGWSYEAVECTGAQLPAFVDGLGSGWRGLSLTMPLKRDVVPLLDRLDDTARLAGAANTLLLEREPAGAIVRRGANTDVAGIVRALDVAGVERSQRAVVLGAGSTARSAVVALARMGAREVVVAARRPEQGRELAPLADELGVALRTAPLDDADAALREADTVISTLPGDAAAAVPLPGGLPEATVLLDVTYAPWPTGIAAGWEHAGGWVVPGIDMLVHQALDQVRLFVAGDADLPLPDEERVLAAMLSSVGRDPDRAWTGA
ncbi:shikimate dehydrogenase [Clavibacter sepedonicus]|uniref:shikimate dehydrogenase (NADP(+)) n=1 Tax=Clavibacter sepedonicus TaxID=31964 RepID=B0REK5_CLASE|nr:MULTISPECIES: shikimate dehydrogenase [Clavibacter]MBD5383233.1 shikimate dehydrogenase [Clavibacter sp.]OQJ49223.1 shikimate dehydrogenase [Clavibacter sepedonicus]OQJ54835.1 shikimate dehydrogenase [Clavibacter sepedonicus]UUK64938.1 shikimate dehydrogenase [Clavibacter sepedonicus]CAQ00852.1 shikimate 5-dehydrogenase [Clavibacter sepedonicus]